MFRLTLAKILNSIVIVGRACLCIDDDQMGGTEPTARKLAVVDPFEQRGNKRILMSQDPSVEGTNPPSCPPPIQLSGKPVTPAQ